MSSSIFSADASTTEQPPTLAMLYGKGVFTTIAVREGVLTLWEKHWRRLTLHANCLNIDLTEFTEPFVTRAAAERLAKERLSKGRLRISFLDESTSPIWKADNIRRTRLFIVSAAPRSAKRSCRLTLSTHSINTTSPLVGIKSCNYLEPLMAHDEARSRGFDEAVRLNERGEVTSACMANVFWRNGERLFTPSLTTGCLAGTTREYILENIECKEVEFGLEAIQEADEIFLTSAGIGVVSVAMFDGKELQNTVHPITKILPF